MKYVIYLILIAVVAGLAIGGLHLYRVSVKNKKEMGKFAEQKVEFNKDLGKVLVIYYSLSGHTKDIAEIIKSKTNADIYEVKVTDKLPKGPMLHVEIKKQLKNKQYPAIELSFPDLEAYDTIFVGAPVWWYTVATPMLSFLNQVDFEGKNVVPFSTQGSNIGTFPEDFEANAKNAKLLKYERFNNMSKEYDEAVDNKISNWLNGL